MNAAQVLKGWLVKEDHHKHLDDLFENNSLLQMHLLNLYGPGLNLDPGARKISQPVYEDEEDNEGDNNDKTEMDEEETNAPTDDEEERTCASVWTRVKSMCATKDEDTEPLVAGTEWRKSLDLSCFNETFNKLRIKASKNPKQHLGRKNETLLDIKIYHTVNRLRSYGNLCHSCDLGHRGHLCHLGHLFHLVHSSFSVFNIVMDTHTNNIRVSRSASQTKMMHNIIL